MTKNLGMTDRHSARGSTVRLIGHRRPRRHLGIAVALIVVSLTAAAVAASARSARTVSARPSLSLALLRPRRTVGRVDYAPTRSQVAAEREGKRPLRGSALKATEDNANKLQYGGGHVQSNVQVYLVFYGNQWQSDPSHLESLVPNFYNGLYGASDTWSNSATQYCQGAARGATACGYAGRIQHPSASPLAGVWNDDEKAPTHPTQAQLEAEAVRAAAHFGNKTRAMNRNAQYVIATAHNNNPTGFGSLWCAWHTDTPSPYGIIAYTNLPYVPDGGWNCGAGYVNTPGEADGVTVLAGHEYVESLTDPYPDSGWVDSGTSEVADKCVWIIPGQQGGGTNINLPTGTFPVQGLWSNNFGTEGGCVTTYVSYANQR